MPTPAPFSSRGSHAFMYISIVFACLVPYFSDLDRFIFTSLDWTYPATKSSSDRFRYDDVNSVCESGFITTPPSSSSSVTYTYGGRGQTIFRVLVTDSRSLANTRGRRPLSKRSLSSFGNLSRGTHFVLLGITSLRFSNVEYNRNRILSTTSCDRFLAMGSTLSGLRRGSPDSKSDT